MDLQTLETGNELLEKYRICETMLEYLSDPESVKGYKYNERCGKFFKLFHDEMLTVTHDFMTKCGEQFSDLHCPEHTEQPDIPTPPTEEKEPKFAIGSKVKIVSGIGKGDVGVVKGYDRGKDLYYVMSDKFYMWFAESELEAYEEENPDYHPSVRDFSLYDRIEIVVGALTGKKGTVVGLNAEDGLLDVLLDGDEDSSSFTPSEVRKIEPENSEENGGGDVDPTEGE